MGTQYGPAGTVFAINQPEVAQRNQVVNTMGAGQQVVPFVNNPQTVVFPTHGTQQDFVTTNVPMRQFLPGGPVQAQFGQISSNNPHLGVVITPTQFPDYSAVNNAVAASIANAPKFSMGDIMKLVSMMPKPTVRRSSGSSGSANATSSTTSSTPSTPSTPSTSAGLPSGGTIWGIPDQIGSYHLLPQYKGKQLVYDNGVIRELRSGEVYPSQTLTRPFNPKLFPTYYTEDPYKALGNGMFPSQQDAQNMNTLGQKMPIDRFQYEFASGGLPEVYVDAYGNLLDSWSVDGSFIDRSKSYFPNQNSLEDFAMALSGVPSGDREQILTRVPAGTRNLVNQYLEWYKNSIKPSTVELNNVFGSNLPPFIPPVSVVPTNLQNQ